MHASCQISHLDHPPGHDYPASVRERKELLCALYILGRMLAIARGVDSQCRLVHAEQA